MSTPEGVFAAFSESLPTLVVLEATEGTKVETCGTDSHGIAGGSAFHPGHPGDRLGSCYNSGRAESEPAFLITGEYEGSIAHGDLLAPHIVFSAVNLKVATSGSFTLPWTT